MDVQYYGANCIRLSTKKASILVDDNLMDLGSKSVAKNGDIVLFTGPHGDSSTNIEEKIVIDKPGEYEVSEVSIQGIAARGHMDEEGQNSATIFKIIDDDIKVVVVGNVFPELSDDQLESIGMVDVLVIPVGGNGYTLDGVGALKLIRKIEPKVVIPTHFEEKGLSFAVPQQPLSEAIKALAMEPKETVSKYKAKPLELTDNTQLIILEKS
ncbi:MBL fold metallo-hydrolase [Candidatus Saccharibacteria bacterium]|nr:MBL fold metallo-hydrolase [Candidatus Saccharibacteria bacterium]